MTLVQTKQDNLLGGIQYIHRFENGYGASVIRNKYSYGGSSGLWELAVIRWDGGDWDIAYNTPITDDVLGYLSDEKVQSLLNQIEMLPDPLLEMLLEFPYSD
jgi:hypothetical protein